MVGVREGFCIVECGGDLGVIRVRDGVVVVAGDKRVIVVEGIG